MVGKRVGADLFPRGAAPSATPRIRKRDGKVLFAPESKRPRRTRPSDTSSSSDSSVIRRGVTLNHAQLSVGMTVLAIVTRSNSSSIHLSLPNGIVGFVSSDEILLEQSFNQNHIPFAKQLHSQSDSDDDEQSIASDSSDEDQNQQQPLWQLLTVGNIVRAAVLDIITNDKGRKVVALSLKPELVNVGLNPTHFLRKGFASYAVIRSVEDHGYTLSFGTNIQHTAFLPFKSIDHTNYQMIKETDTNHRLPSGFPIEVVTTKDTKLPDNVKPNHSSVIRVSAIPTKVLKAAVQHAEGLQYQDLRAGMVLNATVMKDGPGGVLLSLGSIFDILVDSSHVPRNEDGSWKITRGKSALVRLLYVDPSQKRIVGSLLETLVESITPRIVPKSWKIGTLLNKLIVQRVKDDGLLLQYSSQSDENDSQEDDEKNTEQNQLSSEEELIARTIPIQVHVSRISDTAGIKLDSKYSEKMVLPTGARIVSISPLDGSVGVDIRQSILSRKALSIDEIEIGELYDCKVISHSTNSAIHVAIEGDSHLTGIIPQIQISDVPILTKRISQDPSLRIGATIRCRVINVQLHRDRIYLTARKSLTNPKYPLLTSYEQAEKALANLKNRDQDEMSDRDDQGAIFTGSVLYVNEKSNVIVQFCSGIRGLIGYFELPFGQSEKGMKPSQAEVEQFCPVGDTVHVRVKKADAKNRILLVSMNLTVPETVDQPLHLTQIVSGRISSCDEDGKYFTVQVNAEKEIGKKAGSKKSKQKQKNEDQKLIECHLPFGHLSDVLGMSDRLQVELTNMFKLSKNMGKKGEMPTIEAMVISFQHNTPILTVKSSLIESARSKTLPQSFDQIKSFHNGKTSSILRGYVKTILPGGLLVGFLGDVVGYVPVSRIANYFISDVSRAMKLNQSVSAKIESVDIELKRFSLSLRQSEVGDSASASDTFSLFQSLHKWQTVLKKFNEEKETHIGTVHNGTVSTVNTYGITYNLILANSSAMGVALELKEGEQEIESLQENVPEENEKMKNKTKSKEKDSQAPKKGTLEKVRILDVDPLSGVFDLTRKEEIVNGGTKKSVLANGAKLQATVLLVKSAYIIVAVRRSKTRTAIAFALGPPVSDKFVIRPGMSVECTVLDKSQTGTRRNLVMINWDSYQRGSNKFGKSSGNMTDNKSDSVALLKKAIIEDETAVVGMQLKGKITRLLAIGAYVGIGPGVVGHIHQVNMAQIDKSETAKLSLGPLPKEIQSQFTLPEVGTVFNPLFVTNVKQSQLQETSGRAILELANFKATPNDTFEDGDQVIGIVKDLSTRFNTTNDDNNSGTQYNSTVVAISPTQTISCADVDCLFPDGSAELRIGTPVKCFVTKVSDESSRKLQGALSQNGKDQTEFFLGLVCSVLKGVGIQVSIPWLSRHKSAKEMSWGFVSVCDVANSFDDVQQKMETLKKGDVVQVKKIGNLKLAPSKEEPIHLTMRTDNTEGKIDPILEVQGMNKLKAGDPVRGFVRAVSKKGCFVTIGRDVTAQVKLHDLADEYVKDPEKRFPIGTLVSGKLGEPEDVNGKKRLTMILRTRARKSLTTAKVNVNLVEGSQVNGTVKHIEKYGAILQLKQGVTALLHKSEADQDRFIDNPFEEWTLGQNVHAIVIKAEEDKFKIGTKRCYFEAAGLDENVIDELLEENDKSRVSKRNQAKQNEIVDMDTEKNLDTDGNDSEDSDDVPDIILESKSDDDGDEEMQDVLDLEEKQASAPPLNVSGFFDFSGQQPNLKTKSGNIEENSDVESEEEEDEEHNVTKKESEKIKEPSTKKSSKEKREKKRIREAAEKEIQLREESLANNPDSPETADDFERLLMSEPNSSVLWIRYMGFCVSLSQLEKARAIAERALETVKLEAETERMNIWIAYINLESNYGSITSESLSENDKRKRDAAVYRVFDRACERVTNVKNFHLQVAAALSESNSNISNEILRKATKKFRSSKKVWIGLGHSLFMNGKKSEARKTLEKALESLEKRKHVAVICKFAQFEYKYGSVERGRTIFESLAGNFPKRLDLWNIYLDMEENQCRNMQDEDERKKQMIERTRGLYERLTRLDLSSKKMKFGFKKWLEFEKTFGSKEDASKVKQHAKEYVERTISPVEKI